jgi:hypothetical protein
MQIVVLNDRETFSTIDGCRIVEVPDSATTEDIEAILEKGVFPYRPIDAALPMQLVARIAASLQGSGTDSERDLLAEVADTLGVPYERADGE